MPLDVCQRRASECLRFADKPSNPEQRNAWRELALRWRRLSGHVAEFENFAFAPNIPAARAPDEQGGKSP
jgi:hypothetical protein